MDLAAIKQLAYDTMENKSSHPWKERGNKYYHGQRVAKLALILRKHLFPGDRSQDDIITVAAWFHDINNGEENHSALGAENTIEILRNLCTKSELEKIYDMIKKHDDRYSDRRMFSNFQMLHQDADLLDHFGTYDIFSECINNTHHGGTILDLIDRLNNRQIEFQKHRDLLNFDISKYILDDKAEFARRFAERLSIEGVGEIFNEELIMHYFYNKDNY